MIFLMRSIDLCFRFNGVPAEERLTWRSFLVKLGAENLKGVKNEELLVACHKYIFLTIRLLFLVTTFWSNGSNRELVCLFVCFVQVGLYSVHNARGC